MEQEGPSFWVDIKKYEDTLEKDPNSYCFAPLSELYRKIGMIDDAITIAKRGSELHPEYVGGYMALGRGYLEKGLTTEAREALEKVVRVTPENLLAQRLLSKIYLDAGETLSAEGALKAILSQSPEDSESRMLLDSLIRTRSSSEISSRETTNNDFEETNEPITISEAEFTSWEEPEEIIDLEGCEIVEEGEFFDEFSYGSGDKHDTEFDLDHEADSVAPIAQELQEVKDPLTTVTLAELYLAQGYPKRALNIYRELAEADPENMDLKNRILELKKEIDKDEETAREAVMETESSGVMENLDAGTGHPAESADIAGLVSAEETKIDIHESPPIDTIEIMAPAAGIEGIQDAVKQFETQLPLNVDAVQMGNMGLVKEDSGAIPSDEQVVRTLEIWLENIKRRR
jgi:tetratricopeptide (TPR) repeat protein